MPTHTKLSKRVEESNLLEIAKAESENTVDRIDLRRHDRGQLVSLPVTGIRVTLDPSTNVANWYGREARGLRDRIDARSDQSEIVHIS